MDVARGALAGTPVWVWGVLALLVALGVRRLKTRTAALAWAAVPAVVFLVWSLANAAGADDRAAAAGTWAAGFGLGVASLALPLGPRIRRLESGRVLLPASVLPLVLYLGVFVVRYVAEAAPQVGAGSPGWFLAAIAVSALVAGRALAELTAALRNRPASETT